MKNNKTDLIFILDRSGSMCGLEADTIGGFNGMMEKQKAAPGEVNVTTVLFDDRYEVLHNRIPLDALRPLTAEDYYVRGCTALLDAIGKSIANEKAVQAATLPEARADKVLFVITTDGMENASKEYSAPAVRKLIEAQKTQGWEFLFLGANIDAIATASTFGIAADRAVQYHADPVGTCVNFCAVSDAISHFRADALVSSGSAKGGAWKKSIEEDFRSRKSKR